MNTSSDNFKHRTTRLSYPADIRDQFPDCLNDLLTEEGCRALARFEAEGLVKYNDVNRIQKAWFLKYGQVKAFLKEVFKHAKDPGYRHHDERQTRTGTVVRRRSNKMTVLLAFLTTVIHTYDNLQYKDVPSLYNLGMCALNALENEEKEKNQQEIGLEKEKDREEIGPE